MDYPIQQFMSLQYQKVSQKVSHLDPIDRMKVTIQPYISFPIIFPLTVHVYNPIINHS